MKFDATWVKSNKTAWIEHIKRVRSRESSHLSPADVSARVSTTFNIWLGGPCRTSQLRGLRDLIKYCLEKDGFQVHYSENSRRTARIRSMEVGHIGSFDLAILPLLTPGTIAEAFDFMSERSINSKVMIFIPREYRSGFVCKACEELCYVSRDRLFSLSDTFAGSPIFMEQVWRVSDDVRSVKYCSQVP